MEKIKRDLFISIPLLFLIGSVFHFVFNWFGSPSFLAPFFPVNESIWEHTKLLIFPLFLFYLVYYYLYKNKYFIDKENWLTSLLVSIISSVLTMIIFYYTYSGILGKNISIINIFSLLLSLFVGQLIGLKTYKNGKKISFKNLLFFFLFLFLFYLIMTFYPFKIPLFYDMNSHKYSY